MWMVGVDGTNEKKVTIRDVAKLAGVSIGTVSRALNGKPLVSQELQERISSAVAELGYRPNNAARSLRKRSTGYLGILVPSIENPIYVAYVSEAERKSREAGYHLVVGTTGDDSFREKGWLQFLKDGRVDGAAIFIGEETQKDLSKLLKSLGMPIVVLERSAPPDTDSIQVDHRTVTAQAAGYLLSLGHKRIALLTASPITRPTIERIAGVREAFANHGLNDDQVVISTECLGNTMTHAVALDLLSKPDRPTAIIVIASGLAGALRAIRMNNLRIPQDISVICLGDTPLATLVEPAITTVQWDHAAVGRLSIEMLMSRLAGGQAGGRLVGLQSNLVLRASCGQVIGRA